MSTHIPGSRFHSSSGDAPGDQPPPAEHGESGPWTTGTQSGTAPRQQLGPGSSDASPPEAPHSPGPPVSGPQHSGSPGSGPPGPQSPSGLTPQRSPLDWARRRLTNRSSRRLSTVNQRVESRLGHLGPGWRMVDAPDLGTGDGSQGSGGLLAIGPGGVYSVAVVDQGRHRVMLAGDVVQIQGRRPPHVSRARKAAKRTGDALTEAVGTKVPVVPVLTFVGSGAISAHGLPDNCLVVSHRELDRVLVAAGRKISAETAKKLADVASHPATWADHYRWYPDDQTASDSKTAYR